MADASPAQPAAPARLYAPSQVAAATLLGWPLAGALLLSANYRKLGDRDTAGMAIFLGMLGTALLMSLFALLPRTAWTVAGLVALPAAALFLFAHTAHLRHARPPRAVPASWPWTLGTGLACGLATAALLAAFPPEEPTGPLRRVHFGSAEQVEYSPRVRESQARALGAFLIDIGYFDGRGAKTVRLDRRRGTRLVVSFVLKAGRWRDPNLVQSFHRIAGGIAGEVFPGQPVEVRLCDDRLVTRKTIRPGG